MNILPCCALTGDGLGEGLDWLADRLAAKMKRKHKDDQRGVHVTKMPDNENRANLTDLTIRTSEFAMSTNRNGGMNQSIEE